MRRGDYLLFSEGERMGKSGNESRYSQIMQQTGVANSVSVKFARAARRCGIQIEDLKQDAMVSLIHAVDAHRSDSPIPLSKWCARWIMTDLHNSIKRRERENSAVEFSAELAVAA